MRHPFPHSVNMSTMGTDYYSMRLCVRDMIDIIGRDIIYKCPCLDSGSARSVCHVWCQGSSAEMTSLGLGLGYMFIGTSLCCALLLTLGVFIHVRLSVYIHSFICSILNRCYFCQSSVHSIFLSLAFVKAAIYQYAQHHFHF